MNAFNAIGELTPTCLNVPNTILTQNRSLWAHLQWISLREFAACDWGDERETLEPILLACPICRMWLWWQQRATRTHSSSLPIYSVYRLSIWTLHSGKYDLGDWRRRPEGNSPLCDLDRASYSVIHIQQPKPNWSYNIVQVKRPRQGWSYSTVHITWPKLGWSYSMVHMT
jgi:hypothetical protein